MYPDERTATVLPGEGVLNRQAMAAFGGPQGVNAANAGGGGAVAPPALLQVRIGRMEAREIARTDIVSGGVIPSAIRRMMRRRGTETGLSGLPVLA